MCSPAPAVDVGMNRCRGGGGGGGGKREGEGGGEGLRRPSQLFAHWQSSTDVHLPKILFYLSQQFPCSFS